CSVAQGLALGAGVAVVPVPTLLAVAQQAWNEHAAMRVLACLDARMREVYVALYVRGGDEWRTESEPAVMKPAELRVPAGGLWDGAGDGFGAYPELGAHTGVAR